ncbi:hypothetical protein ACFSC6_10660 [Rufibacter sediminis]|uniref:Uncharacterized protein n=1 Tax=Rufibacter sediminis TaxID=2762756 RepID=A0ABR6VPZ1_9BACT|nr:hypothetical protein [Rufibacter sediminis]MBC3538995.1 hypothetical protein [Rufibacter sediminis]
MEKLPIKPKESISKTEKGSKKPTGCFLLLRQGVVEGSFDSFYSACQHGLGKYGSSEFLVRKEGEE